MKCPSCSVEILGSESYCPTCGSKIRLDRHSEDTASSPTLDLSPASPSGPGASTQARFVPGALLAGRYRIVTAVGRGGMGEVYRAEDLRLGQTVALKFLPETLSKRPNAWSDMEREVRIARQISHPNVCRVFDIGETANSPFITMEFIDGEDLSALLKRIGRLPVDKGLQVAHQLCTGLSAAHELGIVHRDLKPANIMLDGRGRVRITDFGLAALVEELRKEHMRDGTPAYMAPEQITGGQVTPRTDIYAAGLVMYELFSGKQAFPFKTVSELQRRSATPPPRISKFVKGLDAPVERMINRCLEPDPEARPKSAMEVVAALPGSDPLRAAMVAGETPSPETVAAAGETVSISLATSLVLLLTVFLGLGAVGVLARYASILGGIQGAKSPEVLADRAHEIIAHFGYAEPAADSAWWFEANIEELAKIPRGSPQALRFVYRQSPRPMLPRDFYADIQMNDPPADVPGMLTVVLDARGRLREFSAVPAPSGKHESVASDWSVFLAEAGIASAEVSAPIPTIVPSSPFDARQDWQAYEAGQLVALTAASYSGKPVYFRQRPAGLESSGRGSTSDNFAGIMFVVAVAVCGIGGAFLARRNMRHGRGDRQGAFRVAIFIFLAEFLSWMLGAHFVFMPNEEYGAFIGGCGNALYVAGFMWILYMAVEPYVRRRWPKILISWTRVLAGHFFDARIGREILVGALGGVLMASLQLGVHALPAWFPVSHILPKEPSTLSLGGPGEVLASLLLRASTAVQWALATISFLLVARVLTRRDWIAVVVSGICLGMVVLTADNFLVAITAAMLCSAIVYFLLFRFGLLSVAVTLFFFVLLQRSPLTWNFSQWFVWRSLFYMTVLAAIAVYGFLAINAGRSLFLDSGLED